MKFKKEILITGGAGFIGSHLTHYFVKKYSDYKITNIDALTYASNYDYIKGLEEFQNYNFEKIDINDYDRLDKLFKRNNFDYVLHLAAESHVDNSIENPVIFAKTNIIGTLNLLNLSKKYWKDLSSKIFYHISTDEVYGSLTCSNNFGPNQNNEKLIPVVINSILNNNQIPVYGSGKNIRDWLYVEDHVMAIDQILTHGQAGETYNIGGGNELSNIELINKIILEMDKILDRPKESSLSLIKYVEDRKGHDFRYAIDCSKLSSELGWHPQKDFKDAIKSTIKWYIDNL